MKRSIVIILSLAILIFSFVGVWGEKKSNADSSKFLEYFTEAVAELKEAIELRVKADNAFKKASQALESASKAYSRSLQSRYFDEAADYFEEGAKFSEKYYLSMQKIAGLLRKTKQAIDG